jgi:hypothetical protein
MPDEQMNNYGSFEEFIDAFSFRDSAEVYSNGVMLIPVFRVKQWMRHMERKQGKNEADDSIRLQCQGVIQNQKADSVD